MKGNDNCRRVDVLHFISLKCARFRGFKVLVFSGSLGTRLSSRNAAQLLSRHRQPASLRSFRELLSSHKNFMATSQPHVQQWYFSLASHRFLYMQFAWIGMQAHKKQGHRGLARRGKAIGSKWVQTAQSDRVLIALICSSGCDKASGCIKNASVLDDR